MRIAFLALLVATACTHRTPTSRAERPALSDTQRTGIRSELESLAHAPVGTGAAVSLSLGDEDFSAAAGTLRDGGEATTTETRFNVASVSKLVTAARVVALAQAHRLRLDAHVSESLPGVVLVDASGRDRASEITVRQLLTHRAGLPHQPGDLDPARIGSSWTDPALLRRLTDDWTITLAREPGTYGYSNVGYALLGAMIERIEDRPFAEAMQPFLAELSMPGATFDATTLGDDAAWGRMSRDGVVSFNAPGWYGSRYALPFTGLWTSMPDLARFGRRLLAAHGDARDPLHAMTVMDGEQAHGLGPIFRKRMGLTSLEHDGGGPGFVAWLLVIPERRLSLAVAANADGETPGVARGLFEATERMVGTAVGQETVP